MTIDALVVGGGPVGLAMGCELLRHGLACRVIEVKPEREVWSKAAAIQPRTLEVFHHMGIAGDIVAMGNPVYGANITSSGKRVSRLELKLEGTRYPFLLGLSQKRTEQRLEAHLEALGGRLERGVELVGFEQRSDHVAAELSSGGQTETVTVPWLIACDGAHSFVRKSLGLSFDGSTFEQELIHADLKVALPPGVEADEAHIFVSEHGPLGLLPLFGEGRYRVIVMAPESELAEPTLANFRAHIERRAPGAAIEISDPEWMIGFRFHSRLIADYRQGRIFFAGDAAHIHSPAGGQGMNMGIQDAFNLAWKLALVQRGAARPELLDSYNAERRPIGERVVNTTDVATRRGLRAMSLRNPLAAALRDQLIRFVLSLDFLAGRLAAGLGGLGVGYPDSPIVGQHHASIWAATIGEDDRTESPSLREWIRFERGPGPGERVADIEIPGTDGTLLDLVSEPTHHLLLFDGAVRSEGGYATLLDVAGEVRSRYAEHITPHILVSAADQLAWDGSVIEDLDLDVHAHFGARSESLYLLRPDGYVGYRSQPVDTARLFEYLGRVFRG